MGRTAVFDHRVRFFQSGHGRGGRPYESAKPIVRGVAPTKEVVPKLAPWGGVETRLIDFAWKAWCDAW
jgi:hypothetical protein